MTFSKQFQGCGPQIGSENSPLDKSKIPGSAYIRISFSIFRNQRVEFFTKLLV